MGSCAAALGLNLVNKTSPKGDPPNLGVFSIIYLFIMFYQNSVFVFLSCQFILPFFPTNNIVRRSYLCYQQLVAKIPANKFIIIN